MMFENITRTFMGYFETKKNIDRAVEFTNRAEGSVFIKPVYTNPNDERSGLNYIGPCRETVKFFLRDPSVKEVIILTEPIKLRNLGEMIIPNRKSVNK